MAKLVCIIGLFVLLANLFYNVKGQGVETKFFEQKLDHVGSTPGTWKQRYLQNKQFYKPGGPIFLYVGGPKFAPIYPEGLQKGSMVTYAMEQGANLIGLETRYFGQSRPTADLSNDNLSKYFYTAQIIADIANFAKWIKTQPEFMNAKVVAFGTGLYGSKVVLVMKKFPGAIDATVASSAPVQVKFEYLEYASNAVDIMKRANSECFDAVHDTLLCFEKVVKGATCQGHNLSDLTKFMNLCGDLDAKNPLDVDGLLLSVLKSIGGVVLTNNPDPNFPYNLDKMCKALSEPSNMTRVEKVANEMKKILTFTKQPCLEVRFERTLGFLQSPAWDSPGTVSGERQSMFVRCNEAALIRTPRAFNLTDEGKFIVDYITQLCQRLFNISPDQVKMNSEKTEALYGRSAPPTPQCGIYVSGTNDLFKSIQFTNQAEVGSCNRVIPIEGASFAKNIGEIKPEGMSYPPALRTAQLEVGKVLADWLKSGNCCSPAAKPLFQTPEEIYDIL